MLLMKLDYLSSISSSATAFLCDTSHVSWSVHVFLLYLQNNNPLFTETEEE